MGFWVQNNFDNFDRLNRSRFANTINTIITNIITMIINTTITTQNRSRDWLNEFVLNVNINGFLESLNLKHVHDAKQDWMSRRGDEYG